MHVTELSKQAVLISPTSRHFSQHAPWENWKDVNDSLLNTWTFV